MYLIKEDMDSEESRSLQAKAVGILIKKPLSIMKSKKTDMIEIRKKGERGLRNVLIDFAEKYLSASDGNGESCLGYDQQW